VEQGHSQQGHSKYQRDRDSVRRVINTGTGIVHGEETGAIVKGHGQDL
jgi:hypothetical protein